jgi:hypothetical protein
VSWGTHRCRQKPWLALVAALLVLAGTGCQVIGDSGPLLSFHGDSIGAQDDAALVDRLSREHRMFRVSRARATIATMLPLIEDMVERPVLPEIAIIELGAGDAQERHGDTRMRQDIVQALGLLRDIPCVRWLNLKIEGVNGFYQGYVARAPSFNRILTRRVQDFPNARVAPYRQWALDHPSSFLADGLHHTASGKLRYADFVRGVANGCP